MRAYKDALAHILMNGTDSTDRTGTGTRRVFGMQTRYNLADGFPLLTTKRVFWKAVVGELLWFLEGSTNRNRLEEITFGTIGQNATIWDEWADQDGDLGPVYGAQWRLAGDSSCVVGIDQIARLIKQIQDTPDSRRLIVNAWNIFEIEDMALPPCHTMWQVVILDGKMHLQLHQRSADMFLGVPFNIASYSLLLMMLAHVTGYEAGEFIHTIGDAHIYLNHMDAVQEQMARSPRPLPTVSLNPEVKSIFDFKMNDITLEGYNPWPTIKAPVAV
ncbi:thymidylate synthase [Aquamicrobium zhengzhouense]|uniref:Thymidylate synthase n=1 Tax=Aquamicrobium zhengzhouense TaxID=2781738 RepID=A0ABS0S9S0_9HYPH|nr:thymidylate synthase [Aquamicrobium zhengzhouense]MBI1620045.1 thymidylate synthase [Aquamicrobium zhengzhouense]